MSDEYQVELSVSDLPLWANDEAREILETVCAEFGVPADVIGELT